MYRYGSRLWRSRRSWQLDWNRNWSRWRAKQIWRGGRGCWRQIEGGWGHCSANILYLMVDLWGNSDFEFSQKVNAQIGTSHSSLQKTGCEKFAVKFHSFLDEPPRGVLLPICPLQRGPDGLEFRLQGTMLKVAPVSTKYLSLVSSSMRKISPALAGKCIAVTVACVGSAANRKWFSGKLIFRPSTRFSTPMSLVGVVIMKFALAIARVLEGIEIWAGGGGGNFWRGHNHSVYRLSSRCWEQGSYFAESWQAWPPWVSHRASVAFTMAAAVMWLPAPTVSRMDGGRRTRNMARKRSLSGKTLGEDVVLTSPWERWA